MILLRQGWVHQDVFFAVVLGAIILLVLESPERAWRIFVKCSPYFTLGFLVIVALDFLGGYSVSKRNPLVLNVLTLSYPLMLAVSAHHIRLKHRIVSVRRPMVTHTHASIHANFVIGPSPPSDLPATSNPSTIQESRQYQTAVSKSDLLP